MRALLTLAVALVAATLASCADLLVGSGAGGGAAVIALQPKFSQRDAQIFDGLSEFGLGVQTLRIVLTRPNSADTLADTTVAFDQDSIAVSIPVQLNAQEEVLIAGLQMYSGDVLVFEGSRSVTARVGVDLVGTPPQLVPVWVGPGNDATSLLITTPDTTILVTETLQLSARAFTASQAEVTDPEYTERFRWRVLDTLLGSVTGTGGLFQGKGVEGTARVVVLAPNLLRDTVAITLITEALVPGQVEVTFDPAIPDGIIAAGGTSQATGLARTVGGTALPGVPVTFVSRNTQVATATTTSTTGATLNALTPGQAIIVAQVNETVADSGLLVVAHAEGPVVFTDLDDFTLPPGTSITVAVLVDMRSSRTLGSGQIDVEWNPAQLTYASHAAGEDASPTVNAADAGTGKLRLAFADAAGFSGRVELLRITFTTSATASTGSLTLTTHELNEGGTGATDLLPITVTVARPFRVQ